MRAPSSILIVHPDRKTQRLVQRILGATGAQLHIVDDLASAAMHLDPPPTLVVLDGTAFGSPHAAPFLAEARRRGTDACIALLADADVAASAAHVPHILALGAVTNLLVHPMPILAEELTITAHKLLRNEVFGVEKYLLWGTELHETTLVRATQRPHLAAGLAAELRTRGQSARVAAMAHLAADELLSNAVHNAPVDAAGAHYRADLARDCELELDEQHRVRLRWGCDARYLAIEVTDWFGSLDRETILHSLAKSDVRESGGGAGMGLALTYRSCDHIVFNLAPGARTEIIALVDVRYPPTERMMASSYNVFVERS